MASKIIIALTVALLLISLTSLWMAVSQVNTPEVSTATAEVSVNVIGPNGLTAEPSSSTGKVIVNVVP